jgi:hypothetical protein
MAASVFGENAVEAVVRSPYFSETYPGLWKQFQSSDNGIRWNTLLPAETMLSIAGRQECVNDFWESPGRDRVLCSSADPTPVGTRAEEGWLKGCVKLDRQLALKTYGAFALYTACNRNFASKREHNYELDLLRESQALRLTVLPTKCLFVIPQPVLIIIRLRNTAALPIKVYGCSPLNGPNVHPALRYLNFHLTSPSGAQLPPPTTWDDSQQVSLEQGLEMRPGEAATQAFNLSSFYAIEKTGRYKFAATHSRAWPSKLVEFDIQH